MKTALERLRERRTAPEYIAPVEAVSARDLRTFRQAMYEAESSEGNGFFEFEGKRYDARAVHRETEDKDFRIEAIIAAQRARQ